MWALDKLNWYLWKEPAALIVAQLVYVTAFIRCITKCAMIQKYIC